MDLLEQLNSAQREAVVYNDGPQLVVAGAGSGKTRVLTYKIAYLLEHGVPAYHILALTFTNKAAREMKKRIQNLVGDETARYLWMGTFHSICTRILRVEAPQLGFTRDFSIYDTPDTKSALKNILKEKQIDDKQYKLNAVMSRISWAKNNMYSPEKYNADRTVQQYDRACRMPLTGMIYSEYQKRLMESNAMDFDDLLYYINMLFAQSPETLQKYQSGFEYILVDEYQDTNYAQYVIVRSLAKPQNKICVVGDDAQSIYSFRGADIQNILNFQSDYPDSRLFKLERNYRSTQNIVNAANSLIRKNIHQIPKQVYSEKDAGTKLLVESLDSDRDEAHFLAQQIKLMRRNSYVYDDMAILYRTNAQSRVIEDELRKQQIPYRIYGGVSFYQRKEIKDAVAYMNLVCNPYNEEALLRIINFPKRGIGDTTMDKVVTVARASGKKVFDVISNPLYYGVDISTATNNRIMRFYEMIRSWQQQNNELSALQMTELILKASGLMTEALTDQTAEGTDRYQNLDELHNSVREYEQTQLQDGTEVVRLSNFLSEVSLATDQDQVEQADDPRVTLMTVHSAKGLEYPVVMIAGMEDNLFPSAFAEMEDNMEEERRLFYVAITRAMDHCIITNARTRFRNGQVNFSLPSRFLRDIDDTYISKKETNYSYSSSSTTSMSRQPRVESRPVNMQPLASARSERVEIDSPYPIGSRVLHGVFGAGTVVAVYNENSNDKIEIDFDKVGKKTLLLRFAKLIKK